MLWKRSDMTDTVVLAGQEGVANRVQNSVGADLSANSRLKNNSLKNVRGQGPHSASLLTFCDTLSGYIPALEPKRPNGR